MHAQSYPVINKNVYAIYCDNISGATLDDNDSGPNRIRWMPWTDWNGYLAISEIENEPFEGKYCFRFTRPPENAWGGGGFNFTGPSGAYRNMSSYYDGAIEFWVRTTDKNNAVTANYEVGVQFTPGVEEFFTLVSLNFISTEPGWQKMYIPLTSPRFDTVKLSSVSASFVIKHDPFSCPIDIDAIVWKKPNLASGQNFSANIKNRSGGASVSSITWSNPAVGSGWQTSDQYIELYLDSDDFVNNNWSVRLYVNNGTGAGGDGYTGSLTTSTVAGLVSSSSDTILPMRFRVIDKDLDAPGEVLFVNENWMYPYWAQMRDENHFDSADELTVWDSRQGFHWNFYRDGLDDDGYPISYYGDLKNDKVLRIYFLADFTDARYGREYRTNTITLECLNE
ncbi:MAG: hypothetical protein FWC88_00935 [Endomicrobia bacterium]|nr:hypothetical protein [Endomicrobiia bacterium]